ncbi:MAG: Eco57I restriction-modification methylase domain-containing protein [bacterium]
MSERIVREWREKILRKLQEVLPANPVEADLRHAIEPLLDRFCEEIGLNPLAHAEYTLATGRADAIFNQLIIEYERPGTLNEKPDKATSHAIQQVKDYIQGLSKKERHKLKRLAGVAFDGHYLIFTRFVNEKWSEEPPVEVNKHSIERFLTWLSSLSSGIALTSENLNRDFAIEQLRTQNILRALSQALDQTLSQPESIVSKLFEQWRLFFSESIDYPEAFGGRKLEPLRKWVRRAGIDVKTPDSAERFFFALHTYFAVLVKFLAWLALSRHLAVKLGAPSFSELVTADGETLRRRLQEMESGGIFRAYGIANLLEGDFFAWYLYAWNPRIGEALRDILKRLDEYDPTTLTIVPEETRDLFKELYHYLLPREIQHNLGEYYTPDWLAQRLLNQVDGEFFTADPRRGEGRLRKKLLETRWLDPACGSGTFLLLVIARMLKLGDALLVNETELLDAMLHNVVGFDLNPLAVLTARANYLLAISDILEYRKGEIAIPVYLADSVRTPTTGEDLFAASTYEFPTAIGKFLVPAPLCIEGRFDRFCDILEESVRSELSTESFVKRIETELSLPPPLGGGQGGGTPPPLGGDWERDWSEQSASKLRDLYERFLELHRKGMDSLWARLLKNNFAPLTVGQFDYIVGNPPWVNWENLPYEYRQTLIPLYQDTYKLFPHKGQRARHGSTKIDISTLMTYVVADKLLKAMGRLGFLITQSVFKTDAGKGFRRFHIPSPIGGRIKEGGTPLRVVHVDDMVNLNPFEGASNRTAVMVLEKGRPTKYPVPYTLWRKQPSTPSPIGGRPGRGHPSPSKGEGKGGGRFLSFTYDSTSEEVTSATKRLNFSAEPVDKKDPTSPWLTAHPQVLKAVRKVLGKSDYEAHEGVNSGGANAVYWVDVVLKRPDGLVVVRNITEGAKVEVEEATEAIEPDPLFPLLRGRDVKRWRAEPSALIIVPQDPADFKHGYPEIKFQKDYPRTYGYLKRFKNTLENRPAYKKYLEPFGELWYSLYDIKNYTFAPWKVVWTRIAQIEAAVVGTRDGKAIVPQETITLVNCKSQEEAHYISALVNSSPFQFAAVSYSQEGGKSMGSMHVLENIRIPRFDPEDPAHRRLAELSASAHESARRGDLEALKRIEAEIDSQSAKVWELTDKELAGIQRSLRELSG